MNKDLLALARLIQPLVKSLRKNALETVAKYPSVGDEATQRELRVSHGFATMDSVFAYSRARESVVHSLYGDIYSRPVPECLLEDATDKQRKTLLETEPLPVLEEIREERMKVLRSGCMAYEKATKKERCLFGKECHKKISRSKIIAARKIIPLCNIRSNERA